MPVVNGKHFPYTKKGKAAAKKAARKSGAKLNVSNYHASRGKVADLGPLKKTLGGRMGY